MSLRDAIIDCLQCDRATYQSRLKDIARNHELTTVDPDTPVDAHDLPSELSTADLTSYERHMVQRIRQLDRVPLGLTISGPAYQDNPILYANQTFQEFTGYELNVLCGQNPRLLQGPETESEAVATLYEAIDIWEPRTVELWNYRQDGTRFRNRVSLVPLTDDSGMISNWLGVQEPVESLGSETDAG